MGDNVVDLQPFNPNDFLNQIRATIDMYFREMDSKIKGYNSMQETTILTYLNGRMNETENLLMKPVMKAALDANEALGMITQVSNTINGVTNTRLADIDDGLNQASGKITNLINDTKAASEQVKDLIGETARNQTDIIKSNLNALGDTMKDAFKDNTDAINKSIDDSKNTVTNAISAGNNQVQNAISSTNTAITNRLTNVQNSIQQDIQVQSSLITTTTGEIKTGIEGLGNSFKDAMTHFWSLVQVWLDSKIELNSRDLVADYTKIFEAQRQAMDILIPKKGG